MVKKEDFINYHPKCVLAVENGVSLYVELDFVKKDYTYLVKAMNDKLQRRFTSLEKAIEHYNTLLEL